MQFTSYMAAQSKTCVVLAHMDSIPTHNMDACVDSLLFCPVQVKGLLRTTPTSKDSTKWWRIHSLRINSELEHAVKVAGKDFIGLH